MSKIIKFGGISLIALGMLVLVALGVALIKGFSSADAYFVRLHGSSGGHWISPLDISLAAACAVIVGVVLLVIGRRVGRKAFNRAPA